MEEQKIYSEVELKNKLRDVYGEGIQTRLAEVFHLNKSNLCRQLNGDYKMKASIYMTGLHILDLAASPDYNPAQILKHLESYVITNEMIGNVLSALRTNQCINYSDLTAKLYCAGIEACSYSYIRNREMNITNILAEDISAYCDIFDISPYEIINISLSVHVA